MSKGVLIQASFYEAMQVLPDQERLQLYDGICEYTLKGILPENLSPIAKSMFILMKPNIDSSAKKYTASVSNGKKGGRKAKNRQYRCERTDRLMCLCRESCARQARLIPSMWKVKLTCSSTDMWPEAMHCFTMLQFFVGLLS